MISNFFGNRGTTGVPRELADFINGYDFIVSGAATSAYSSSFMAPAAQQRQSLSELVVSECARRGVNPRHSPTLGML